jgi:tetratricopeptide (TPR) repeat protein
MNLGILYSQWMGELRTAGKRKESRDAAAKVASYMPSAQSQLTLGVMDYELGDKPAALSDFRKALEMDPTSAVNSKRLHLRNPAAGSASAPSWTTTNS